MFNGIKVLVTGHTGFKGGWLSIWLDMLGADVVGCALDPVHERGIFKSAGVGEILKDYRVDIRKRDELIAIFIEEQPEIVFHLAAQPLVLNGYNNPTETFEVNTMGTVNVLEAIRLTQSVRAGVIVTTDKCYENREWVWGYRENDRLGGKDPYSASKSAAEIATGCYRDSFFRDRSRLQVATVRAGNVIGGGDWSENRIFPDIIRNLETGKVIDVRMPGAVRPWQHLLDPLWGYLQLARQMLGGEGRYDEPWNFGPDTGALITVKQLVDAAIKEYGRGEWIHKPQGNPVAETGILALDTGKARSVLGWHPVIDFEDAVRMATDWYRAQVSGANMLEYTRNQVNDFLSLWNSSEEK